MEERIIELLKDKQYPELRSILEDMNPADISALFENLPADRLPLLFRLLPKELAADTFVEMEANAQAMLIQVKEQ